MTQAATRHQTKGPEPTPNKTVRTSQIRPLRHNHMQLFERVHEVQCEKLDALMVGLALEQHHDLARHFSSQPWQKEPLVENDFGVRAVPPHVVYETNVFTFDGDRNFGQLQSSNFTLQLITTCQPLYVPFVDLGLQNFIVLLLVLMITGVVFRIPHHRVDMTKPILFTAHALVTRLERLHQVGCAW